jgi:hypothetical protein
MRKLGGVAFGVTMAIAGVARAEPTPDEAGVAREQFRRGIESVDAGRWEDARAAFQRSYEAWPRPFTLLNLAGAQSQTGKLLASEESYRKFLREATGPAVEQKGAAEAALADVQKRMPHVKLAPSSPLLPSDTLAIDERPIANVMVGILLPVDPGEHEVVVGRGGVPVVRVKLAVAEGEAKDVALAVPPPPPPPPKPVVLAPVPPPPRRARDEGVFGSPWFWLASSVAIGATAAVLIAKD